jgi:hypothetical protein
MLTEAQVAKARTFPGCGDITADTAVDKLFAAAETLQTTAAQVGGTDKHALALKVTALETQLAEAKASVPVKFPPEVLRAMAHAARTQMRAAVKIQAVTPVVAEMLAARLIGTDDAPSAVGLTPSASGECVATAVFEALSGNGPAPRIGELGESQPAPRVAHGQPEDGKPVADGRIRELMGMTPLGQVSLNNNGNGNGHK